MELKFKLKSITMKDLIILFVFSSFMMSFSNGATLMEYPGDFQYNNPSYSLDELYWRTYSPQPYNTELPDGQIQAKKTLTPNRPAINKQFQPKDFSESVTGFSWKLFQGSKLANSAGNLVLSPILVQLLLAILEHAAEGETKYQLQKILGYSGANEIQSSLRQNSRMTTISSATGIFIDSSAQLNQSFANFVENVGSEIKALDFQNSEKTKNFINEWASHATQGHVNELLSSTYHIENTEIILTSAIFFHSAWKYKFNPIGPMLFENSNQQILFGKRNNKMDFQVEFMEVKQNFIFKTIDLGSNNTGKLIEIPYEGDDYSMVIIVPDDSISLDRFIRQLDVSTFNDILKTIKDLPRVPMTLRIPKFRVKSHFSVVNSLLKMDLVNLFTINSKLPYIGLKDEQKISDIIQQAVLNVDENGTIAAAATAIHIIPLSAFHNEFTVTVNRSFLSVILDKRHSIPLFISKIFTPTP